MCIRDRPKTGTIELTEQLEAALKDLQKNLPADVHVSTDIFRQSRFIESSIGNVKDCLLYTSCHTLSIREIVLRWSGRMGPVSLLCLRYWQEYRRLLQVVFLFRVM